MSSFGTNEESVEKFEKLLGAVNDIIMKAEIFEGSLEQNFQCIGDEDIEISKQFREELLHFVKSHLDRVLVPIGSNSELNEKDQVISAFALYALYRRLSPPNIPPDVQLFKAFWRVQKTVPFVVICDKHLWYPGNVHFVYT